MPILRLPDKVRACVDTIINLDGNQFNDLIANLTSSVPRITPQQFVKEISLKVNSIDDGTITIIVIGILSLYSAMEDRGGPVDEFVDDVCRSVNERAEPAFSPGKYDLIREKLTPFLVIKGPLSITSKANEVYGDHGNVFCDARILTDIRPIFGENPAEPPSAYAIVHTLKIEFHEGSRHREFFVAMDSDDVAKLKDVLMRDAAKSESLKLMLSTSSIPSLED